ncbi:MAG TPA: large-conductance mechanosensitive channel protein MscL [Caulobacteraceae bacterium]|nr:large-conductance mechanosensitive channel protein MscL [Caulobacteraceae bacterium]
MNIVREFREFIVRGSVIDLAVGVIIGGAFGKIVASIVSDLVMPPIGLALGRVEFDQLKLVIQSADAAHHRPEVAIRWGSFINALVQFVVVAAVVFFLVKVINTLRRRQADAAAVAPAPTPSEALLGEIRDSLKRIESRTP